jgi:D-threo-aldose 1-dehydrogenase
LEPTDRRRLGRSGVEVTTLGLGGAAIGELYTDVPEEASFATIGAAWDAGIRFFDTAPWYGRGLSELRMGSGLRGRPRDEFVLSTKIGRWLRAVGDDHPRDPWHGGLPFEVVFDYSYDGIMRAYEQSQLRLGLTRYDVAVIHDLDVLYHKQESRWATYMGQLSTSGWRAIEELRRNGLIRAIGAGINENGLMPRFLELMDLDFFLVAMPYTLLRQEVLDSEFPLAVERGTGFVIGSPFQSGILATGPSPGAKYDYAEASAEVLDRVGRIQEVCARHDVPLAAAALQFPLGHPSVASVIPGASRPEHVQRNVDAFRHAIPGDLWAELKHEGLLRDDAPVPGAAD